MNRRHKIILSLLLAITGLALLNGATIPQSLGIILLGGGLAWLIGSQFVLAGAMFIWRHRIWAVIIAAVGGGVSYGWIRYDAHQSEKRQAIYECEERNNFIANSHAKCEKDPSVTLPFTPSDDTGLLPGETLAPPTPDPYAVLPRKAQPATKRGKVIHERITCDDLVVYDRDKYAGGDPLVIDQLATGATVQVLGHVTVSDEDIINTPNGRRGFISPGCLEAIPVVKNDSEEHKPVAKDDSEEHKQWCSKHPLDDSCEF